RALLGGGEAAVPLGVALRPLGALVGLPCPPTPLAHLVAGDPGGPPNENAEEERGQREAPVRDRRRAHVGGEESEDDGGGGPDARTGRGVGGKEEEGDSRPEGWPEGVSEAVQDRAGGGGQREDAERRAASGDERERGQRGQRHAEGIEASGRVVAEPQQCQRR